MSLIIPEKPLIVLPSLAKSLGLGGAMWVQQLHYYLTHMGHRKGERLWYYKSVEKWVEEDFPFFSARTMQRVIAQVEQSGVVTAGVFNKQARDRTKWYSINYEHPKLSSELGPSRQFVVMQDDKLTQPLPKKSSSQKKKSVFGPDILPALAEVWTELVGGAFPYAKAGGNLKPIAADLKRDGATVAADAFRRYLKDLDDVKYASLPRFAATYGRWKPTPKAATKKDTRDEALQ